MGLIAKKSLGLLLKAQGFNLYILLICYIKESALPQPL